MKKPWTILALLAGLLLLAITFYASIIAPSNECKKAVNESVNAVEGSMQSFEIIDGTVRAKISIVEDAEKALDKL